MADECFHARAPFFGAAAVEFVQYDIFRLYFRKRLLFHQHQLAVGVKLDVLWHGPARMLPVFKLRFKNVLAGGQPAHAALGVVLRQGERDKAFARARGMDNGSFAGFLQQGLGGAVCRRIMRKQFHAHFFHPLSVRKFTTLDELCSR